MRVVLLPGIDGKRHSSLFGRKLVSAAPIVGRVRRKLMEWNKIILMVRVIEAE